MALRACRDRRSYRVHRLPIGSRSGTERLDIQTIIRALDILSAGTNPIPSVTYPRQGPCTMQFHIQVTDDPPRPAKTAQRRLPALGK